MIEFNCPACRKPIRVQDAYAGRNGRCKYCSCAIIVPKPKTPKSPTSNNTSEAVTPDRRLPDNQPPQPASGQPRLLEASDRSQPSVAVNIPAATGWPPPLTPPRARPAAAAGGSKEESGKAPALPQEVGGAISPTPMNLPDMRGAKPIPAKLPPRTRRLLADSQLVTAAFQSFPLIEIREITGNPADLYRVLYRVNGLARGAGGQPVLRNEHLVEIRLTLDYPRQSPRCKMLTPVFHPNIEPATICVGDHWTAGERLVDLIIRIGEMLAYQAYNIKSPLDGEAAMWADLNQHMLPIDNRDLRPAALI